MEVEVNDAEGMVVGRHGFPPAFTGPHTSLASSCLLSCSLLGFHCLVHPNQQPLADCLQVIEAALMFAGDA